PILHGLIFDLDGTLTLPPPPWFFPSLRAASGAPPGVDILHYISTLPPSAQSAANAHLEAIERRAMSSMQPQPGLPSLLAWCEVNNIRTGVVTRNFDEPVSHLVTTHLTSRDPETGRERRHEFMPVLTRGFREVKPSPGPLLECMRVWGTGCGNVLMVGDSKDDVEAARRAGVGCVVVRNEGNGEVAEMEGVVGVVERLEEL
ncbi:HAD-like protein, partial [Ascodesmis nigricans]